jgi:hypothetical protein
MARITGMSHQAEPVKQILLYLGWWESKMLKPYGGKFDNMLQNVMFTF